MLVNGEIIQNFIERLGNIVHHNIHLHLTVYCYVRTLELIKQYVIHINQDYVIAIIKNLNSKNETNERNFFLNDQNM